MRATGVWAALLAACVFLGPNPALADSVSVSTAPALAVTGGLEELGALADGVMPGDVRACSLVVENAGDKPVRVLLGAQAADKGAPGSLVAVSRLTVRVGGEEVFAGPLASLGEGAVADLGLVWPGGTVAADLELEVPGSLGNEHAMERSELLWQVTAQLDDEVPAEGGLPETGDLVPAPTALGAGAAMALLAVYTREGRRS